MSQVVFPVDGNPHLFVFWCDGCGYSHHIDTTRWQFNGDLERPTVTPSLLLHPGTNHPRCHIFITDGSIRYLGDCGHELAGQTVPMIPPP
jgi:hypothetical protein